MVVEGSVKLDKMHVLDPDDIGILASIAENPQSADPRVDRLVKKLKPRSQEIARAILAEASGRSAAGSATFARQTARAILNWVRANREERTFATINSSKSLP